MRRLALVAATFFTLAACGAHSQPAAPAAGGGTR